MYEEGRDVLEGEMREIDKCNMEEFDTLDSSEKTIAILGGRWCPQVAKQGDKTSKSLHVIYGNNVMGAQLFKVSIRSRNGAPSRKGCVVYGQMTKASNK